MFQDLFSRAKILIVDDEPSNVRLLERILEMHGATHLHATTDARQALPLFLEYEPDLVLLDLHMPHVSGFEVIEQLRRARPDGDHPPILVLTADITVETKRKALSCGAQDFVIKPLDHLEVVLRIKNLIENRFLRVELQKQNCSLEQQVAERTAQLGDTLEQLRATQENIVRQERLSALGMMAGGIAHDFNNALTMMLGYGELLLPFMEESAPPREIGFLRNVINAANDAAHVVSRLRDFYRPAGGDEIRLAVDLNALVNEIVSLTIPKWKGRSRADGVQITVDTDLGSVPEIAGNAAELREVMTNLIFNAVDAMPGGGGIRIGTARRGDGVAVSVSDTGIGMSEAEKERCLEPFFTTKGERGTGLGLSVVYGIVQRHGGGIEIETEEGRGTTFIISLPIETPRAAEEPPSFAEFDRQLKILVVDDQEIICELITEHLKVDGHDLAVAFDGNSALEAFRTSHFDLVITDQSMPGMNGEQLAAAIGILAPDTAIILLTGFAEEMHAAGNLPPDIDLVVGKPISAAALRSAIREVMTGSPLMTC